MKHTQTQILSGLMLAVLAIVGAAVMYFVQSTDLFAAGFDFQKSGVLDPGYQDVFNDKKELIKPQEGNSVQEIRRLFYENLIPLFKYIFIFVTLIIWSVYITMMIASTGNEEQISTQRKNLLWGLIGFGLISLAIQLGDVLDPVNNNRDIIDIEGAQTQLQKVISYLQLIITAIALVAIFYAASQFITAAGEEEQIDKSKKIFTWGFGGMIVAMLADPIVNTVFYPEPDGQLGTAEIGSFALQVTGVVKFLLMFLGVLAMAAMIIAGFYYITSFGDEERQTKARTIILGTIGGIIVIASAYVLVSTVVPTGSKVLPAP